MTRKHGSLSDKKREAAIATMKESAKKQCPHKQASEHEMVSTHDVLFIFDQSSCHKKADEKALIAKNILVKDGGPRRVRDTVWAGSSSKQWSLQLDVKRVCMKHSSGTLL